MLFSCFCSLLLAFARFCLLFSCSGEVCILSPLNKYGAVLAFFLLLLAFACFCSLLLALFLLRRGILFVLSPLARSTEKARQGSLILNRHGCLFIFQHCRAWYYYRKSCQWKLDFQQAWMPVQILMLQSVILLWERHSVEPTFWTGMDACSNFKVAESDATTRKARQGSSILNRHRCLFIFQHCKVWYSYRKNGQWKLDFPQAWMPVQILTLQSMMLLGKGSARNLDFEQFIFRCCRVWYYYGKSSLWNLDFEQAWMPVQISTLQSMILLQEKLSVDWIFDKHWRLINCLQEARDKMASSKLVLVDPTCKSNWLQELRNKMTPNP